MYSEQMSVSNWTDGKLLTEEDKKTCSFDFRKQGSIKIK
jgi:hypothetical protein